MNVELIVSPSVAKMSAQTLALELVRSTMRTAQYAAHAARSGREYFAIVVEVLNGSMVKMSPEQVAIFKTHGPVKALRNACNREKTDFTIASSKHGGLSVISREGSTKQTGKAKPETAPGPVKTSATTEPQGEEPAETLRADVARLKGELTAAAARESELRAALTSAESRAVTAESRAIAAESRAKSAESALASLAKPVAIQPPAAADADFRNIRESSTVVA